MAENRVKVVGYAEKQVFNGNIEYRNFSDDLVGLQQTDGNSTFTMGNFQITTTLDGKPNKIFSTNKFSNFVSLCDLDLTLEESKVLLNNNSEVKLKLDKTNPQNYAYFGSLLEYVRVSLEDVITKWPASLYMTPILERSTSELTIEGYFYDTLVDESIFKINSKVIKNPYLLNYLENGSVVDTFNEGNDLRNLSVNYSKYSVLRSGVEYEVLEFTGSTYLTDDYIYFKVKGNPFSEITGTTGTTAYHIKPNKLIEDTFFNNLPDFESNLLNRLTTPKYTSTYKFPERTDSGYLLYKTKSLTWPTSDGYNIDFNSTDYTEFVSDLILISTEFDDNKTNLMVRFLTAEAISDFDTTPRCDGDDEEETAGQKMNKTLKIYGREYDEIKRYIDGIQFANTVTYNQLNNTPDAILKNLARTMGWGLVQSVLENDLLKNYVTSTQSTYSGMSVGYTAIEAEVEMWRRLILNSPWLWKSKGARKSIEFLFKFIGAPDGLIEFNEFVYMAQNTIDVNLFEYLLEQNGLDTNLSLYSLDSDGYPRVQNNNRDMYYQKGGLWYRQTAGPNATIDILTGNNPHVGPYDGGAAYINQFNELIPNFSAVTVTSTTTTTDTTQLFTNYDSGKINSYEGAYYVDVISLDNISIDSAVTITTTKILDPSPTPSEVTDCGCDVDDEDYALLIGVSCEDIDPFKVILNPKGNDGVIFSVDESTNEECTLNISFDYLFQIDCEEVLTKINNATSGCTTVTEILEKMDISMTLELVDPSTNDLSTVYEESIFNIGSGNLPTYLNDTSPKTGFLFSADSNTTFCETIASNLMTELSQQLPLSGSSEIETLVNDSINSTWFNFNTNIINQTTLDLIYNEKIKLSFKINDCCIDLGILVDRIKLDRNCKTLTSVEYDVNKSPSFNMIRVSDNKKSWLGNDDFKEREYDLKHRETKYNVDNYKLIINSKEVNLDINPSNAIEQDLFCYVRDNSCILDPLSATCTPTTATTCCGDGAIDINEMLTTDLSAITSSNEFKDVISSELINVKGWKTMSSYPTLKLVYDRYMNSTDYCDTLSSQFDYSDMINFSELVGTYWVDLIEQVIPSTTIWGSTYVYGNTTFDQQKFKYQKYSLFESSAPIYNGNVVSPVSGNTSDVEITTEIIRNSNYDDVSGSTTGQTFINTDLGSVSGASIIQLSCGSEFIGNIIDFSEQTTGGTVTVITECALSIDSFNVGYEGFGSYVISANISGADGSISYLWTDESLNTYPSSSIGPSGIGVGTYTLTITDEGGCTDTNSVTVIETEPYQ